MKSSKKSIDKCNNIFVFLGILIVVIFGIVMYNGYLFNKGNNDKELYMLDIVNMNIDSVYDVLDNYGFNIDVTTFIKMKRRVL